MEQFFASLSKRQTMLLLTSLAFGGSEASFEHLAPEDEELLKHRAQHLLQIPRDKRIPLVIQEMKRIYNARRRQLANADPKRLATLLSKERGGLIEVVLRALPSDLADACRAEMGPRPTTKLQREVRPDILSIIRWKLEEGLKQGAPQVGTFRFSDVLMMPQREVLSICDRMGARVLATAVAGLDDAEREAFLAKLAPDQRTLASRAAEAGKVRKLSDADARTVLEMHGALEDPSMGMRSAGAQRVIRAALAQAPEFAQRLSERHQGHDLGKLLARWLKEEKGKPMKGDGGRLDIVEQMERLAQKGVIDRPLRLPPPMRAPQLAAAAMLPVPVSAPRRTASQVMSRRDLALEPLPPEGSKVIAKPEGSRVLAAPVRRTEREGERPERPDERPDRDRHDRDRSADRMNQPSRRDPIAERNARRAGVTSGRPELAKADDRSSSGVRIMRDGKPLARETEPAAPRSPRRAKTSPVVQELPKRRERPAPDGQPKRGPKDGSS